MAHFAELDTNNIVLRVVVISNDDLLDENGIEQEALGIAVCKQIFGGDTKWKQTSYNSAFRKHYAGIGFKYDEDADIFYYPTCVFPSWVLDENFDWQPPIPRPSEEAEGATWEWDEETISWKSVTIDVGGN